MNILILEVNHGLNNIIMLILDVKPSINNINIVLNDEEETNELAPVSRISPLC